MDKSRNITSVSTSASALYVRADHFVLCSTVIHGLTNSDPHMDKMYNQFGPTPRICFDSSATRLSLSIKLAIKRHSESFH